MWILFVVNAITIIIKFIKIIQKYQHSQISQQLLMWHRISIKKQQDQSGSPVKSQKHYERVVPLNQQQIKDRKSKSKNKEKHIRNKSLTEGRKQKSPRSPSINQQLVHKSSEEFITRPRLDRSHIQQDKDKDKDYMHSLNVSKFHKQQQSTSPVPSVREIKTQGEVDNSSAVSALKEKINSLKNELRMQRKKNQQYVLMLQLKLRKVEKVNIVCKNKLSEFSTRMLVMRSAVEEEMKKYCIQVNIILNNLISQIFSNVFQKKGVEQPVLSQRLNTFPIKQQLQQSNSHISADPEEKLIKIIDNIKKMRSQSQNKGTVMNSKKPPILASFISELNNYSQSKNDQE